MSELMQPGNYKGDLVDWAVGVSGQGKPQIVLTFEIGEGSKKMVFLSLSDGAWEYAEPKLKKLGFNGKFTAPEFSNTQDIELWMKHKRKYNAETGAEDGELVESWDIGGGGYRPAEADADTLRRLDARWRSATPASATSTKATKPTAPSPTQSTPARTTPARPATPAFGKDQLWDKCQELKYKPDDFFGVIDDYCKRNNKTEANLIESDWKSIAENLPPF